MRLSHLSSPQAVIVGLARRYAVTAFLGYSSTHDRSLCSDLVHIYLVLLTKHPSECTVCSDPLSLRPLDQPGDHLDLSTLLPHFTPTDLHLWPQSVLFRLASSAYSRYLVRVQQWLVSRQILPSVNLAGQPHSSWTYLFAHEVLVSQRAQYAMPWHLKGLTLPTLSLCTQQKICSRRRSATQLSWQANDPP